MSVRLSMRHWVRYTGVIGLFWMLSVPCAQAATVTLRVSEGPYYVDVPIQLQVSAEGFEESPQPEIHVVPPAQGQLVLQGVSPSVSSSIQIVNGTMKQWKSVRFNYKYSFLAHQSGHYTVGPFTLRQGNTVLSTQSVPFKVGAVPTGGKQRVRLLLPEGPFVIGQRIPVALEWWIHTDLVDKLVQQEARVPLFERVDAFRFLDEEETETQNTMAIHTPSGLMRFPATTKRATWEGEPYVVLTVSRTAVPLHSGTHRIQPASIILEEGVRWRRSLFGQTTATHVRKLRVQDREHTVLVKPLPLQGRPASFAGAIGQGFTLEVTAQRTVLQAGDPVRLTVTLRGDSDALATASLPSLMGEGGLSKQHFRVPEGETAGLIQEGSKQFEVTVRVLHEGVQEIPPIPYSWFDPQQARYQTTYSRPIALSVRAAHRVSAADVVRHHAAEPVVPPGQEAVEAVEAVEAEPSASRAPVAVAEARSTFTLVGADLAIERNPDSLLRGHRTLLEGWMVQIFCYLLGVSAIGVAVWKRRMIGEDPAVVARQKRLRGYMAQVEGAVSVQEVADTLRQMAALVTEVPRQELNALLERCDNVLFAPGGRQARVEEGVREQAIRLAHQIVEKNG